MQKKTCNRQHDREEGKKESRQRPGPRELSKGKKKSCKDKKRSYEQKAEGEE